VTTIIVVLFLAHPNIVKTMFSVFSCQEIDSGEWWILEDMNLPCFKDDHPKYVMLIGVPGLILWGIGIPAVTLFALVKYRKKL
jgi:hypothetical protein